MSNEVQLIIDGARFRYWENVRLSSAIDNISTIEFNAPWDPNDPASRDTFRPFSYKLLDVTIDEKPSLTGRMALIDPTLSPSKSTQTAGGYSLPGVLGECTPGVVSLPLEFKKQNVHQIAAALAKPFGIEIKVETDPGPVFDKVAIDPADKILPSISDLAKQRNQVISNTVKGELLFRQSIKTGSPVVKLEQGAPPLLGVKPAFDPSSYYSELTGLKPMNVRSKKSYQITVQNTLFSDVYRPFMFRTEDTKDADTLAAVEAKIGRMFGNMVSYSITVATWRTPAGDLWEPNTFLQLKAPGVMIYNEYKFLIRKVILRKTPGSEVATLELVLPGAFEGTQPRSMPWDE